MLPNSGSTTSFGKGRIWTAGTSDQGGWGSPYTGGGIHDPRDVTGGHFDHVHVGIWG